MGGVGAAHVAMEALGLAPVPVSYAGPPSLPPESGKGVKIVILGAGIAGLTAGFELRKAGYDITILEARDRVGLLSKILRNIATVRRDHLAIGAFKLWNERQKIRRLVARLPIAPTVESAKA